MSKFNLIGIITSVDRNARTMTVRELQSQKNYTVKIPANMQIKLYQGSPTANYQRFVHFEQVMKGLIAELVVSKSVEAAEQN